MKIDNETPSRILLGWIMRWGGPRAVYLRLVGGCVLICGNEEHLPYVGTDQWVLPEHSPVHAGISDFLGPALHHRDLTPGMSKVASLIDVCKALGAAERSLTNCVQFGALSKETVPRFRGLTTSTSTVLAAAWKELTEAIKNLRPERLIVMNLGLEVMLEAREEAHPLLKTDKAQLMPEFDEYWAIKEYRRNINLNSQQQDDERRKND